MNPWHPSCSRHPDVNFTNILRTNISYARTLFSSYVSSYVFALAKKIVQKTRAYNVDEIDGWC